MIFAVGNGLTDDIAIEDIKRYESELIAYLRDSGSEGLGLVRDTGKLEDETAAKLKADIEGFNKNHWNKSGAAAVKTETPAAEESSEGDAKAEGSDSES